MTREIRSRRAGLSRDESRQQPLYSRLLGLQYVTPNGFLCFVFFEGAVALGILLALAELVSWWGVLVLPITVAVMVKLNDVVAGAVIQTPSNVSRPSRTPALRAPASRIPTASRTSVPGELSFSADHGEPATRIMPAAVPAVRRAAVRAAVSPDTGYPATGYRTAGYETTGHPAGGYPADGLGGVGYATGDIRAADSAVVSTASTNAVDASTANASTANASTANASTANASTANASIRTASVTDAVPATVRAGHMLPTVARASGGFGGRPATDAVPDVSPLNGPPVATHWEAPTERLDSPLRWARQAASRRYE